MKPINLIGILFLVQSCNNGLSPVEAAMPTDRGIILSCIRCGCMEDLMTRYVTSNGFGLIPVYTDTNCLPKNSVLKKSIHLSQSRIDSLLKENYNVIFFKKLPGIMYYRVLNTEEVLSFGKICKQFFKE